MRKSPGKKPMEHNGSGQLRIIGGGGHELRHDPRAVAVLLGWLSRQHNATVAVD